MAKTTKTDNRDFNSFNSKCQFSIAWESNLWLVHLLFPLSRLKFLANLAKLSPEEELARDKLISYIVADDIYKGTVSNACSWYSRYLQSKFIEHWHQLVPALVDLNESDTPEEKDLVIAFRFVQVVAKMLKTRTNCALSDIVDELGNDGLLKEQLDGERAIPNQIVFAAVGWLSTRCYTNCWCYNN
jgi:hypothetical protein